LQTFFLMLAWNQDFPDPGFLWTWCDWCAWWDSGWHKVRAQEIQAIVSNVINILISDRIYSRWESKWHGAPRYSERMTEYFFSSQSLLEAPRKVKSKWERIHVSFEITLTF
jgi:hypothetical protein